MPIPKYSIQYYRGLNYASHYEKRQLALTFPENFRNSVIRTIDDSELPPPRLNTWGCDTYQNPAIREQIKIAAIFRDGFPAYLVNPWYWSQEGWEDFLRQWEELPETIPMGVDKREVIHNLSGLYESIKEER